MYNIRVITPDDNIMYTAPVCLACYYYRTVLKFKVRPEPALTQASVYI